LFFTLLRDLIFDEGHVLKAAHGGFFDCDPEVTPDGESSDAVLDQM